MNRYFGQVCPFHMTPEPLLILYFCQIDELYARGARSFLFLTVPPLERTPLFLQQGPSTVAKVRSATNDYNAQLASRVASLAKTYKNIGQVTLFDTGKVFNTLLDNSQTFGFVNATGYSEAYQNGTPAKTTQIAPYAPVSSFLYVCSTFFLIEYWLCYIWFVKTVGSIPFIHCSPYTSKLYQTTNYELFWFSPIVFSPRLFRQRLARLLLLNHLIWKTLSLVLNCGKFGWPKARAWKWMNFLEGKIGQTGIHFLTANCWPLWSWYRS